MSIELTTRSIGTKEIFYDDFVEQGVDCDITMPDYCPDIMRIIKCSLTAGITNSKLIGDRATADGNAKIRIIYADEKNNICSYDHDYPFSKYAELSTAYDNAFLCCNVKTEYVNCRAVSKRRIDVHGIVSLRFRVVGDKSLSLICDACGDGVQLKRKGIDIDDVVAVAVRSFEVAQVENVGDANGGIGKILDAFASPVLNECKLIKGKMLIKGELFVRVVYCSDSGSNEACVLNCLIPFNEIAEASAVTDGCKVDVKMHVTRLTAEPKTDNDGEYRYMNINAEVLAQLTAYERKSVSVVTDTYSTDYETDTQFDPVEFMQVSHTVRENVLCKHNLDLSSMKPQKLYTFSVMAPESKCCIQDDKIIVIGKIPVNLIVMDSDGVPMLCEREAEFECVKNIDDGENLVFDPYVSIGGCSASLNSDGSVEFKAEVLINGQVMKRVGERVLVSLATKDASMKKDKKSCVVVYFCSGDESVWEIARKYNTTVEEIMEENELSTDYPENERMLLIPVK